MSLSRSCLSNRTMNGKVIIPFFLVKFYFFANVFIQMIFLEKWLMFNSKLDVFSQFTFTVFNIRVNRNVYHWTNNHELWGRKLSCDSIIQIWKLDDISLVWCAVILYCFYAFAYWSTRTIVLLTNDSDHPKVIFFFLITLDYFYNDK